MKAIITGITGQDGSHLADLLLEKGYDVVGVSRRSSTDNTDRIKHILNNERFSLVQGDITDTHSIINILRLPNIYGKWSKPNYNSAVATFCYNLSRNIKLRIDNSKSNLNLLYIL